MKLLKRLNSLGPITEIPSGRTLNSHKLYLAIEARTEQFKKQGLQTGDRVLLHHGNSIAFFIDLLSVWRSGAGVVPVDKSNLKNPAVHSLARFEILVDEGPLVPLHSGIQTDYDEGGHLILYTSGSTGANKAVVHTLTTLENRIAALEKNLPVSEFERSLCLLPTHFGHGLIGNSLFPLLTGQHLFIASAFDPTSIASLANIADKYQITFLSSVPSLWRLMKGHRGPDLNTLRRIHCASAPFSDDLYDQIKKWAPSAKIFNVYGTTEFASWISGYEIQSPADGPFVGAGWDTEFKLTEIDENGLGRVFAHSSSLMKCYLKQPEETNKKILHKDQKIWFDTGDLGIWDAQKGLKIMGRSDDLINKGGAKINPNEIESLLLMHSEIESVCVFSLPHEMAGEIVAAAVVLKKHSQIQTHELESWCREKITSYKVPTRWFILKTMPVSTRGKISRRSLRELCLTMEKST